MLVAVALQWRNPALVGRRPLPLFAFVLADAAAVRGGADLILASWDLDVALTVLADLARALPGDAALATALTASDVRLTSQPPRTRRDVQD